MSMLLAPKKTEAAAKPAAPKDKANPSAQSVAVTPPNPKPQTAIPKTQSEGSSDNAQDKNQEN
jgi:hypothetical protein